MNKHTVLKQIFGYDTFRHGQEELIDAQIKGRDVLGIMPTGAGKSICYQVPALLAEGVTLVISPLISLMKDQVNALTQAGVAAAFINSSLTQQQYETALYNAQQGQYKIIYVAPERLATPRFQNFLQHTATAAVIVDEAHCVSQWGHDFRPAYLAIKAFLATFTKRPTVGAFTATATQNVRADIITQLGLEDPQVLVTGFNRQNLYFETRQPRDKGGELLRLLAERTGRTGIVYCATRAGVEEVCTLLVQNGILATRYHAGLGAEERQRNQNDFVHDRAKVMVATNAFGMGIDKSNVAFVIHYNMPKNVESYYQEAGRAGRDGEPADCILLYSPKDVQVNRFLINNSQDAKRDMPQKARETLLQNDLEMLKAITFYSTTHECLRRQILSYFGETAPIYCGNCGNCNQKYDTVDITVDAQKILSCVSRIERMGHTAGKTMVANILHGNSNDKILQNGYEALPTYGIMASTPVRRIVYTIEYLLGQGYMAQSDGEYPVLSTNSKTAVGLRGQTPLAMKLPQDREPRAPRKRKNADMPKDSALFEKLAVLRIALARKAGVPAYVVFTDASLRDMCQKMPTADQAFLDVSGVGQAKLNKYGKAFMEVIKSYKQQLQQEEKTN